MQSWNISTKVFLIKLGKNQWHYIGPSAILCANFTHVLGDSFAMKRCRKATKTIKEQEIYLTLNNKRTSLCYPNKTKAE